MWLRISIRRYSSFKASDLVVTQRGALKPQPELVPTIPFGKYTSDHMLIIEWSREDGWEAPQIKPYGDFSLDPSAAVLHYANTCFEGMKAYKNSEGRILMFRPDMNMKRLQSS